SVNPVKLFDPNKKEEPKVEEPKPVEPKPPFEPKDFLPLAAALLLALALITAGKFMKSGLTQVATAQKPISLEQKGDWALGMHREIEEDNDENKNLPEPAQAERFNPNEIERLVSKIAFVCMELSDRLNDLVRV